MHIIERLLTGEEPYGTLNAEIESMIKEDDYSELELYPKVIELLN